MFFFPEIFLLFNFFLIFSLFLVFSISFIKNNFNLIKINIFKFLIIFAVLINLWYILLLIQTINIEYLDLGNNFFYSKQSFWFKLIISFLNLLYLLSINYIIFINKKIYLKNNLKLFFNYYTGFELSLIYLLIFFALICILMANNFLILYLLLEFQALACYILIALKIKDRFSTEAALKYFLIGSISSIFYLLGCLILYKYFGIFSFLELKALSIFFLINNNNLIFYFLCSQLFLICYFLIKLGIVPFHFWMVDVYSGTNSFVTYFLFLIPKFTLFFCLFNLIFNIYYFNFIFNIYFIFVICGLFSIIIGSIFALSTFKIKKFLVYSSISNFGFLLLSLSNITIESLFIIIFYLLSYSISIISIFLFIIYFEYKNNFEILTFKNFFIFSESSIILQILLFIQLLSAGALPPFFLFFSKSFILLNLTEMFFNINIIFLLFCICSIFSIFYYLRLIRFIIINKYNNNYTLFINDSVNYSFIYLQIFLAFSQISIILFSDFIICYLNYIYYMYI